MRHTRLNKTLAEHETALNMYANAKRGSSEVVLLRAATIQR